ncbi:16S rRNA (cytosine(967)-C(5))-methyltransferase RsmB [Desulfurobacterium indicum]|uniref:16S rRNA (cytosine(967)-C(5))-methyltransferase n=1 Tax=Desulfurobacterium indicum TaxID=1914305 RepID=A0A1R1ML15_9BACT|nr:16S rRNA (cytosine(967)-C(5))-methyltransferase RsmB [Desulfurobacterium indicum]OMH40501.1 16S rRNA (cytosine(967)-C(5))-methyltransferase [Desulfurobacterium indicum]
MNTRETAVKILCNFEKDLKLKPHFESLTNHLNFRDRSFVRELTSGTVRFLKLLDFSIEKVSGKKQKKQKPFVRNALRILAYQLFFMSVPPYAALNETVEAVKKFNKKSAGFVNAVGKKLIKFDYKKEIQNIPNKIERIATLFSFETWMVKRWKTFYQDYIELLEGLNKTPSLFLRINRIKTSPENFAKLLKKAHVEFEPHPFLPDMFRIKGKVEITSIPGYKEGFFYIQDPASFLSAVLLNPQQNEKILDIAAAPGGKTTAIGSLTEGKAEITAVDIDEKRLKLLKENVQKAELKCKILLEDITRETSLPENYFDRILLDAPCSATGVIRRHPEGKWNKSMELIKHNRKIQQNLLKSAYKLLKSGGRLLYSVCSLEREEGEENVEYAINIGFKPADFDIKFEDVGASCENMIRVFPHKNNTDAFFYAIFTK